MNAYYTLLFAGECQKNTLLGKRGKGKTSLSWYCQSGGFIGEFATLSRRFCFNHPSGHMADVLRQIPSDLTAGSKPETLTGAWKQTLSHIEMLPAHCTDVHMHTHCPFCHQLWEGHACNFHTAHWMCWLDEFLKNSWIIRSGCNSSALHPSYSVFIWAGRKAPPFGSPRKLCNMPYFIVP